MALDWQDIALKVSLSLPGVGGLPSRSLVLGRSGLGVCLASCCFLEVGRVFCSVERYRWSLSLLRPFESCLGLGVGLSRLCWSSGNGFYVQHHDLAHVFNCRGKVSVLSCHDLTWPLANITRTGHTEIPKNKCIQNINSHLSVRRG